ncbi:MAG: carboxypeptidase regulatory-like domain-containing protein, partial [Clostridia bacterium]|nr:carboxypeptidase regulatory-like domain-containing protein [Clostridia bacterium]
CPNWHGPWDGALAGDFYEGLFGTVDAAVSELKAKGYSPKVRGFVWMQGETDGEIQFNNGLRKGAENYEHNLTELFKAVRVKLNEPDLPIVFGEIYEYSQPLSIEQSGRGRDIVAAQRNVGNLANNYLVTTGDLMIDASVDPWHWQGQSARLLGVRFGEKMYEAVYMNSTDQTEYKKGVVYGKVFDNYGNPLSGVTVSADDRITQTDDDGSYILTVNRAADHILLFEKEGFGSVTRLVRADRYKSGKLRGVESFMHRKATIEGIVEDESGLPLSGVSVVCGSQRVTTDENGKYSFSVFPELYSANAKYEIVISKGGYASAVYTHTFGYAAETIGYNIDLGVLKLNKTA